MIVTEREGRGRWFDRPIGFAQRHAAMLLFLPIVAWLAVQAASIGFPAFDAPAWALRVFILVLLLAWAVAAV